jgi:ATP-dependent Clp protease ATP-binding subunit ClpC
VFERFTERARQVVVLAQDEARSLGHNYIGTEHLLLGLLREEEGVGAQVLAELGVTLDEVRDQVVRIVGEGDRVAPGHAQIPFTPRAKKVLELSLREGLSLGHTYIGTEHILLGLTRENDGVAARILLDLGIGADPVREKIVERLGIDLAAIQRASKGRRLGRWRPSTPGMGMSVSQPSWEYRVERCDRVEAQFLNDLGEEGWELVSINPTADWLELIFKRRRFPGALRAAG